MVPVAALERLEPMRKIVSREDGIRGEFRLVTMASIPWTSPECWRHQSDFSSHIITTFNPVCKGDVADGEQNGALRETNRRCCSHCNKTVLYKANTRADL